MNDEVINDENITTLFRNKGILSNSNRVISLTKEFQFSEGSLAFLSRLKYDQNNNNLPKSVFVKQDKIRGTKHYKNLMRNEIEYYKLIHKYKINYMPEMLAADYNNQFSYLILKDYTSTHIVNTYETDIEFYKLAARKIAEHHHKCIELNLTSQFIDEYSPMSYSFIDLNIIKTNHQKMVSLLGNSLTPMVKNILESVICKLENNIETINSYLASKKQTIVHGDYHLRNCLFNQKSIENMLVIDWQWCNTGIGTYDVSHLLNLYLPRKYKSNELDILQIYFNRLKELQYDYSWTECLYDYTIFSMLNLFKPAYYAIACKLRRKTKFWVEFLNNIIISYKNLRKNWIL